MTVKEALDSAGTADLDAELLLAFVLDRPRTWVLAHPDASVPPAERLRFRTLAERRRAGEPVAYLTGRKEFYGRTFAVSPDVLCPRPETEGLVEQALATLEPDDVVFDIGTGSGCVGITIALERLDVSVTLTDISEPALAVARQNAQRLRAEVDFGQADGLPEAALAVEPERLVIVSNLPYLETADVPPPFEPSLAFEGGDDGLRVIRAFIGQLRDLRLPPRHVFLEHRKSHGEAIRGLLGPKATTFADLAGHERITGY